MRVTIQFIMSCGKKWSMTRDFEDGGHIANFIKHIERTKGWMLDEVWKA
jgi:hypothetical protein